MTLNDGLLIAAVVAAPFLAVFAQRQVELWRERRGRTLAVFKTLMATRGRSLSPEHVQALNVIELEFVRKSDEPVLTAWRVYRDHLYSYPRDGEDLEGRVTRWHELTQDLLASLLGKMGDSLGYRFDPVQIKKGAYSPEAHAVAETEMHLLRRAILLWLTGQQTVSVSVVPEDEEAAARGKKFLDGILELLDGKRPIRVELSPDQGGESGGARDADASGAGSPGNLRHS